MLRHLAGRELTPSPSVQRDRKGRTLSHSTNWVERDRVSVSELAQGRDGFALGLDARNHLQWIQLTPAYRDAAISPLPRATLARADDLARALTPLIERRSFEGPRTDLSNTRDHASLADGHSAFPHPSPEQLGEEIVDRAGEFPSGLGRRGRRWPRP